MLLVKTDFVTRLGEMYQSVPRYGEMNYFSELECHPSVNSCVTSRLEILLT